MRRKRWDVCVGVWVLCGAGSLVLPELDSPDLASSPSALLSHEPESQTAFNQFKYTHTVTLTLIYAN